MLDPQRPLTGFRRTALGKVAERDLRSVFIAVWGERPVSEITKTDVLEIIIKRTKKFDLDRPKLSGTP